MNEFAMIKNQQHIYDVLKKNKLNDRLSHAYLFYGDDGVGKKEMAYALACLFYCPNGGCLECDECRTILEGHHLNVSYIGILESKKLISKEQIASLQEEFSKTSLVEGPRIYIVDGIDTASGSAQNSLLKFIEEPINNTPTIGIFIAKDLANVVSTIVSRCSQIYFPSISLDRLIDSLREEHIEELDACLASILTNSIEEAMALILKNEFIKMKDFFKAFLDIKNKKQAILLDVNSSALLTTDNMKMFFKWLIAFYEDCFKKDKDALILATLYDKISIYKQRDYRALKSQFELILELYSKLDYNISAKNIFHELISRLF